MSEVKQKRPKKSCKWNCVRGYCLSYTADYDESQCKFNKQPDSLPPAPKQDK